MIFQGCYLTLPYRSNGCEKVKGVLDFMLKLCRFYSVNFFLFSGAIWPSSLIMSLVFRWEFYWVSRLLLIFLKFG